jgi:cobalt-zinc-cadmium efflux system protein
MIISIVAGIGICINAASAFLFFREKDEDLNVKSAYLHLLVDALVSVGVVVAGVLISFTGMTWIDPLISLVIMVIVVYSTWSLLTQSLGLALDGVPEGIDMRKIEKKIVAIQGVKGIHHVHIWPMSTTKNAMTAHIVLDEKVSEKESITIKDKIRHTLEHDNIHHVTLELEREDCGGDC